MDILNKFICNINSIYTSNLHFNNIIAKVYEKFALKSFIHVYFLNLDSFYFYYKSNYYKAIEIEYGIETVGLVTDNRSHKPLELQVLSRSTPRLHQPFG